ncbi:ABC transporter ATP-binding protein [Alsobacter sp. SYSU M60028]|uniref:ABC transporter ATP-binding protein n=1 Tax=Alsobacter ponti TaxID=2962936 RepID=A0ABT1LEE8_9HYPH|nr:ABC transporter ATP-binding protein [Alsobacter ponti]MCP8939491.1 ABC transporter ATP-binding protein [Alsobacter ponti]
MTREEAGGSPAGDAPLVALRGIVKRFGDLTANDHVDLDVRPGEIHALLGENGAGKSTLVKILFGLLQPNEGEIIWQGRRVTLDNPEDAADLGIGMVFQHFSLFENLTVAENIAVALPRGESLRDLDKRIAEVGARYGLALDPGRPVWTLSAGERQRIEIVRALLREPRLLILDEPTSVLTPQEADTLFVTLDRLAAGGCGLLYITHRLEEVKRLCQRATVMRAGKVVAACDPRVESVSRLASLMVGSEVVEVRPAPAHAAGPVRFELRDLSLAPTEAHGIPLAGVSLAVRGGEIVGIAGVAGNGQSELFAAMSGEVEAETQEAVRIDGQPVGRMGIDRRRRRNAAFVPEERNGHAAAPRFTLSENIVLSLHATSGVARRGLVNGAMARQLAAAVIKAFDVRKGGADPMAGTLSGGNLQKFVVGREILREPGVLVVNQPTWGVDAGAAATIRQALIDLAARGAAVVVISQDLDEIFAIADRIAVIHDGRLSAAHPAREIGREQIGLLMAGSGEGHAHAA